MAFMPSKLLFSLFFGSKSNVCMSKCIRWWHDIWPAIGPPSGRIPFSDQFSDLFSSTAPPSGEFFYLYSNFVLN